MIVMNEESSRVVDYPSRVVIYTLKTIKSESRLI